MASTSPQPTSDHPGMIELHAPTTIVLYTPDPDSIEPITANVPTVQPFYKYGGNPTLRMRRSNAYQWVSDLIEGQPDFTKLRHAHRYVFSTLRQETQLLTEVLASPLRGRKTLIHEERGKKKEEEITVYSLDPTLFQQSMYSLYKAREFAKDSFAIKGKKLPEVPGWLPIGGVIGEDFVTDNDIELLCIVHRGRVESFLAELTEIHDYRTGLPVGFQALEDDYLSRAVAINNHPSARKKAEVRPSDSITADLRAHRLRKAPGYYEAGMNSRTTSNLKSSNSHIRQNSRLRKLVEEEETDDSGVESDAGEDHRRGNGPPDDEPSGSDSDNAGNPRWNKGNHRSGRSGSIGNSRQNSRVDSSVNGYQFDLRLKQEVVPTWDGDTDVIVRWINKVNDIARYGKRVRKQLGSIVPRRLQGTAETWYYSLPQDTRTDLEKDWRNLRRKISGYYMNRKWLENIRRKARSAYYRESGFSRETPSEYFIRKMDLLNIGYDYEDSEIILEIMEGAPPSWSTILTTQSYDSAEDLQDAIRYHEATLTRLEPDGVKFYQRGENDRNFKPSYKPRTYLIGQRNDLPPPPFPKDDSNISKKTTPRDKGARPCRHCGSDLHWDNECKHSRKTARVRLCEASTSDLEAQDEYEELFDQLNSHEQDFEQALQTSETSTVSEGVNTIDAGVELDGVRSYRTGTQVKLNRKARRQLTRDGSQSFTSHAKQTTVSADPGTVLELSKRMNRPPGCSFLGAKATETTATVNNLTEPIPVIIDSGSDITLIAQSTLNSLTSRPRIKNGQRVKLIQVTGSSSISGFVTLDLYFHSKQGPVKINVDAYVVNGMSTPFILGNDFQDQFDLSVIRKDGRSFLKFGESDREVEVENSVSSKLTDEAGHAFKILVDSNRVRGLPRRFQHRKRQKYLRKLRTRLNKGEVHARARTIIPPESCKQVAVEAQFPNGADCLYVERNIRIGQTEDQVHGSPDCLIVQSNPCLLVSNFSRFPIVIAAGESLGKCHNPLTWLDKAYRMRPEDLQRARMHATLVRQLVKANKEVRAQAVHSESITSSKAHMNHSGPDDPTAEEPVEGGPKTAEVGLEEIASDKLLKEVHISSDLSPEQRRAIEEVITTNKEAFGLDGRLGNFPGKIEVPMKPGAQPVSLPPFPASPANREVMDKQIDSWLQLGVIEPSNSPWGAPVFIVHRNGKPRMVIDLRKLNEQVVADEFPLPRQEDIMQALVGSQWLTSLDALAGFTQLTMSDDAKEKLAFRCHRGLFHFNRMPFGYRNGPSVFQRVMQGVLAPFLWIFALVYIDDIVIFSRSFEEHLKHLDQVFRAIAAAKITLSPAKCHFAFQSLLLLGQKVSRLGMSTHKEKVDAIVQLAEPRNTHELQTFLGMMVYFTSYIPFYAWIAQPLFQLLKKGVVWEWKAVHQEAFDLCKQVLTHAPVRGYAQQGKPYRLYTDACDYGLAGILQQVQPIHVRDLKGTKLYERLAAAHQNGEPIPTLVTRISKELDDIPEPGSWNTNLDDSIVYIERVIGYWSRVLKSPERNYSATEREALALKEALIKFQPFIEGEQVLAITDHAALTWSTTFQNVNRRLLTWGTVFAAYPGLKIVHRAGKVHSNVDPISRLRRRTPPQYSPDISSINAIPVLSTEQDGIRSIYDELGPRFEEKLLTVAARFCEVMEGEDLADGEIHAICFPLDEDKEYSVSQTYSVLVGIPNEEMESWRKGYETDDLFRPIVSNLVDRGDSKPQYPNYFLADNGLLYFEDWHGNNRLCVPQTLKATVMGDVHDTLTESAHGGYYRCYNRLAATYYWPRMGKDLKSFIASCDICQKAKPRRHAPYGLLQPIPIPEQPFEVVTMDFIPELPTTEQGHDNILVIVDKLTKFMIAIPCSTTITETETARLFFKHIISKYGIPRQVITDRDTRWRNDFWEEVCRLMGMKRSLTTAYHPQADGQTEIMNQTMEIALRAFVGPSRTDWDNYLDGFSLSYNTTPHTSSHFTPAYLLYGYHPTTRSSLLVPSEAIPRPETGGGESRELEIIRHEVAQQLVDQFQAERSRAKDALYLAQEHQRRAYNNGRLDAEFEEGDLVVFNPHSLKLLQEEKGRGKKLLLRYEGPFEIIRKLSPVTYQLRLPVSYGIHPILNIAHLERYQQSPPEFGERPIKALRRKDFNELPEEEVEAIVAEKWFKVGQRRVRKYKVRFQGFPPGHDEWKTKQGLRNAPEIMEEWLRQKETTKH